MRLGHILEPEPFGFLEILRSIIITSWNVDSAWTYHDGVLVRERDNICGVEVRANVLNVVPRPKLRLYHGTQAILKILAFLFPRFRRQVSLQV